MGLLNKKLVLIVEDDPQLGKIYTDILTKSGYEARLASGAGLGLELIDSLKWDLLLLDIMLPIRDGISILKEMGEKQLKKGKIIMLTNLNNDNIIHDAFKYGADGYIIKSEVTPGGLIQEIEGVLK